MAWMLRRVRRGIGIVSPDFKLDARQVVPTKEHNSIDLVGY